jgi:DNA-binding MarR family transcriptional regulator
LSLTSALGTVQARGPVSPSELAKHERLARPGASRLIARLRDEGLVDCDADPSDGRSYRVTITPRGEELLRRARQRSTRFLSHALRSLDERELAVLAEATTLLERMMETER